VRSTHAPLQLVSGEVQVAAQAPLEQTVPVAHALPQAPQFAGSALRSTHVVPQSVSVDTGQPVGPPSAESVPSVSLFSVSVPSVSLVSVSVPSVSVASESVTVESLTAVSARVSVPPSPLLVSSTVPVSSSGVPSAPSSPPHPASGAHARSGTRTSQRMFRMDWPRLKEWDAGPPSNAGMVQSVGTATAADPGSFPMRNARAAGCRPVRRRGSRGPARGLRRCCLRWSSTSNHRSDRSTTRRSPAGCARAAGTPPSKPA
jgi:hypothetical protein